MWPPSGHAADDLLERWKEPEALQGFVQPARRDAVIPVVGGGVMNPMALGAQDDVPALEQTSERRGLRRVRPLVELVGGEDPHQERAQERGEQREAWRSRPEGNEVGRSRDGEGDQAVAAVHLDEVVARDGEGVDVVLAKGPYEHLADDGRLGRAPRVSRPVEHPRHEIGRHI